MPKQPADPTPFLKKVSVGPVVVRITEVKSASSGKLFRITPPGGGKIIHRADIDDATIEARAIAAQLSQGVAAIHNLEAIDIQELHQARVLAASQGTPLLLAMNEWAAARAFGVPLIEAARVLAQKLKGNVVRIMLGDAIVKFKGSRRSDKAELTYGAKMKIIEAGLGTTTYIDTLTVTDYSNFLNKFSDNETYNDIRKRIITLMRWAKSQNYLPRGIELEIENTVRAPDKKDEERVIGIIQADQLSKFLEWVRKNHSWALAGAVLSATLGLRQDEVQGKRTPPKVKRGKTPEARRQVWEDIDLDNPDPKKRSLSVTVAKNNTPSMRDMPITDQAAAWLKLCYVDGKKPSGYVIEKGGAAKLRVLALEAEKELGFKIPPNALRHSWITADICHTNGKNAPATALKAGNSVQIIHSRYKGKMKDWQADEYLAVMPKPAA
jgi:hypothetical protein